MGIGFDYLEYISTSVVMLRYPLRTPLVDVLAPTFVPLDLLDGWLKTAARANPITYVLEAMRALINYGWSGAPVAQALLACLILAAAMYLLAIFALRVRTSRK